MGAAADLWDLTRKYWPLLLGNSLEWYEFAVYGYMETYMEKNFFEGSALATWAGFTATFLARPLGGLVLGRRIAVIISVIGMLIGTAGQGLLPCPRTTQSSFLSTLSVVVLFALRLLQGLCTGGEISSVSTYIVEVGEKRSLARCTALISMTVNLGFMMARAVIFALQSHLGEDGMLDWGWRVPFLLSLLPGSVAVAGRICLRESGEYTRDHKAHEAEAAEEAKAPLRHVCRALRGSHLLAILVGVGGVCNIAVFQYGGLVWSNSYLKKHGAAVSTIMEAGICSRLTQMVMSLAVGWLADMYGVGFVALAGAWTLLAAGFPMFAALRADPTSEMNVFITYGLGYALSACLCGSTIFMYVAELFPTSVRNAGVGVSFNIGFCFFGGFAPLLAEASLSWTPYGPGLLYAASGAVTLLTVVASVKFQQAGWIQLAHIRPDPYMGSWARGAPMEKGEEGEALESDYDEAETSEDEQEV